MKRSNQKRRTQIISYLKWLLVSLLLLVVVSLMFLFLMSKKYTHDHKNDKTQFGVTYSARQAEKFNLNPDEVLNALLDDAGFRRFRLMSYWNDIETTKGQYNYNQLDAQIKAVEKRGGTVTLAIGLRQPRWPECFLPDWTTNLSINDYRKELDDFIAKTVNRYKDNKTIVSWQLENEFHLNVFGICSDHSRRRLIEEYQLVKSIDKSKPVIMSLANNYFGFPVGDPRPDQFGVSIYSKVYESRFLKKYFTYPFPNWYYGGRAGVTELLTGRASMIHELQLEPWGPKDITEMDTAEQYKSMDVKRIKRQLEFAESTGMKTIDLWGGEWWYWRKVTFNDPAPWETVKSHINNSN